MPGNSNYMPRLLPLRLPRVCVAIVGVTPAEMFEKAEAVVRENPFIELRLDYIRQPALALQRLRRFADFHPEALVIATCRRAVNGGKFRGSVAAQVDVLVKAAASGSQFVDLELESAAALKSKDLDRLRAAAAVILSFHDFRATRKLDETFQRMAAFPADYYKVVSTANSLYDNVVTMKFLERQSEKHSMIGLSMGEQGIISRVLCVRAGSVFTFASAAAGEETAPGQITARTLRDTYRIDQVDAATKVYGVAGDPVAHSLSPLMLNTAFRRENVNAVYLALHATKLTDLLACVRDIPLHGLSVTMPYKQAIIEHLDNTDAVTEKIGACNTVIRAQDGKLYGYNTDVSGVVRPLEQRLHLSGAKVLVVGAGGSARAAVFGLKERGAEVFIINRTTSAGQKLARQARAKFLNRTQMRSLEFDVIVNATPVGMGGAKVSPLSEKELNARILFEMVYTPAETRLVKMARDKGLQVITGVEMFVQQGARQFEIWTGKPAPADDMQRVVTAALQARTANGNHKQGASELAAS
jgi:3-dehydroquinate dehydratase / shikimate dehydrogenase